MTTVALTAAQQAAVAVLVSRRRIRQVQADEAKAKRFLLQAQEALTAISGVTSTNVRYDVGYNASHDVGEAVLAAYGYRTGSGSGQHVAVGEFLEAVFDTPPAQAAARSYDQLRAARNGLRYLANPVGKAQSDLAYNSAATLLAAAQSRIT